MADLTVVLNMYSLPFPNIVNNIRVDVSRQDNISVIVATETDSNVGHPARKWLFPGLPRTNYLVVMNEIDVNGLPLNQLANFDVVPDQNVYVVRNDEQLKVGVTPGFVAGATTMFFDGGVVGTLTPSTLAKQYDQNYSPNTYAVSFSGTVNVGDKIQVNYSYDERARLAGDLTSTNSNPANNIYKGTLSGTPLATDTLNITGNVDGVDYTYFSDAGFTTIATLLNNLLSKLIAGGKNAAVSGNSITVTGTNSSFGALYVNNAFGSVPHTGTHTSTAATNQLTDLINLLRNELAATAPTATLLDFDDGTYKGIMFGGYTYATLVTTITKITSSATTKRPDFRGWNINPERRNQPGTMIRGEEYSWDSTTGKFQLLIVGDIFLPSEPYNIDFDPQEIKAGGSVPPSGGTPVASAKFTCRLITVNSTVKLEDFGNKIILEPSSNYMELTFPDITGIPDCLPLTIEAYGTSDFCVKFKFTGTKVWQYGTDVFICRGESIRIHNFLRLPNTPEWRFDNLFGNWGKVGNITELDITESGVMNLLLLNGQIVSNQKYARLWQYVSVLPANQRKDYSDGITTFFSTLSGTNFRLPDRRGLYDRVTNTEIAGTYRRQQVEKHKHITGTGAGSAAAPPFGRTGVYGKQGWKDLDTDNDYFFTNDGLEYAGSGQLNIADVVGTETRPNSYSINKYIIV